MTVGTRDCESVTYAQNHNDFLPQAALLESIEDISTCDRKISLLDAVCSACQEKCVDSLISDDRDIYASDASDVTLLLWATCNFGHEDCVSQLLDAGANVSNL